MQERHNDRRRYFEEQARTARAYYVAFISHAANFISHAANNGLLNESVNSSAPAFQRVLEVGCGEGGNLVPFAELGCEVWGIDLAACRIDEAKRFFVERNLAATFVCGEVVRERSRARMALCYFLIA